MKLANFDNSKWSYEDLKSYAKKYRNMLAEDKEASFYIKHALDMYQSQCRTLLISNLKKVQKYLYN